MLPLFSPFQWGPQAPAVIPPPPPPPPLWTRIGAAGTWGAHGTVARTPRFEHIYAQVPNASVDRGVNFIHRISSQNPFIIATGNAVVIASHLSEP